MKCPVCKKEGTTESVRYSGFEKMVMEIQTCENGHRFGKKRMATSKEERELPGQYEEMFI